MEALALPFSILDKYSLEIPVLELRSLNVRELFFLKSFNINPKTLVSLISTKTQNLCPLLAYTSSCFGFYFKWQ